MATQSQTYAQALASPVYQGGKFSINPIIPVVEDRFRSFDTLRAAVKSWPSALGEYVKDESLCCMIHKRVSFSKELCGGCEAKPVGYHKSVQAVYAPHGSVVKCFARVGQLVLDRVVADEAFAMRRPGCAPLDGSNVMGRKYGQGLPISVDAYGAGYCYLQGFSVGRRSRIARILGPLPLVADVLRLSRLFGDGYAYARWVPVGPGLFHVENLPASEVVIEGKFFNDGWDIVEKCVQARVGVDLSELPFGAIVEMTEHAVAGFRRGVTGTGGSDSDGGSQFLDCSEVYEGEYVSVGGARSSQKGEVVSSGAADDLVQGEKRVMKEFCKDCGFLVNPLDHSVRCGVKLVADHTLFYKAWLGDAAHRRDVRFYILYSSGVPKQQMGALESSLICASHQSSFYKDYVGSKEMVRGSSERAHSSAFEASYHGKFRLDYIRCCLAVDFMDCIPEYARSYR